MGYGYIQTCLLTVVRLHSLAIYKVVFLAKVCPGWFWMFVLVQLHYQLRAAILQGLVSYKSFIVPYNAIFTVVSCDTRSHVYGVYCKMRPNIWTSLLFRHEKDEKFSWMIQNGQIYNHNVLQICVQYQKENNYINGLISQLFLCNFDVQSVSLCGIH